MRGRTAAVKRKTRETDIALALGVKRLARQRSVMKRLT